MYKIWFEKTVPDDYRPLFENVADGICPADQPDRWHNLEEADAVMAGGNSYDAECMDRAPRLLIIARTGIGYDKVDIAAASAPPIAVVNAPASPPPAISPWSMRQTPPPSPLPSKPSP